MPRPGLSHHMSAAQLATHNLPKFPQPPITQWKVEAPTSMNGHYFRIVNLDSEMADALDEAAEYGPVTVYGRRRLNDYVGSPIWSDWEAQ